MYGPGVDMVLSEQQFAGGVAQSPQYQLTDHLGTVRGIAQRVGGASSATLVNAVQYDAFGKVTSQSNATNQPHHGFAGRDIEPVGGLTYNRNRYYSTSSGRFISQDPIGFAAGDANLYRYVGNESTMYTDPSGLAKAGSGHHYVPQELWGGFTEEVTKIWDASNARIHHKYYNFHDGSTINGVSHDAYNNAVRNEMNTFLKGKPMTPELAQKFLERIQGTKNQGTKNKVIRAFNEGVAQEAALAAKIGEAEYRIRLAQIKEKKNTKAFTEASDAAFEAARLEAELQVKKKREIAEEALEKIANRLSKLDGVWGFIKRSVGAVAKHTPIVVGGYVYYTEGNINKALAESTPLSFSLMAGEAIGSFYEYAQEQIEETAFENRYSEKLYMGSESGRQKAYEDACRERERNGLR
jgi:RHS repeat-associated protein